MRLQTSVDSARQRPSRTSARLRRGLAVLCASLVFASGAAVPAWANDATDETSKNWPLSVAAEVTPEGVLEVTESFQWNLEDTMPPFVRALPLFVPRVEQSWRKFEYSDFSVESTYDLNLTVADDSHQLLARLELTADAAQEIEALTSDEPITLDITFTYKVRGALSVLSPSNAATNELFWAPLASGGTTRTDLDFTVSAPRPMRDSQCSVILDDGTLLGWSDAIDRKPEDVTDELEGAPTPTCKTSAKSAQVQAKNLNRYSTVVVRVNYPMGTLTEDSAISVIEPDQQDDSASGSDTFDPTWSENIDFGLDQGTGVLLPALAGVAAIALALGIVFFTRRLPDYRFSGIGHGDTVAARELHEILQNGEPTANAKVTIVRAKKDLSGPPRIDLPNDLPAGLSGGLWALELSWNDIWAILAELAHNGQLGVSVTPASLDSDESAPSTQDEHAQDLEWTLIRSESPAPLNTYEQALVDALFSNGPELTVQSLHSAFAPQLLEVLALVGQELKERDLVVSPIDNAVARRSRRMQRTALGRAFAEQLDSVGTSLSSSASDSAAFAEFPEAPTTALFETYLPTAIALGRAAEWAEKFDHSGVAFLLPQWFEVHGIDVTNFSEFVALWRRSLV